MSEIVLDIIWDFRYLISFVIPIGLLILIVAFFMASKLEWNKGQMKFFGLFYKLNFHESIWVSAGALRIIFILSCVVFGLSMNTHYLVFFILVSLICCLATFDIGRLFIEIVNSSVLYGSLFALGILMAYYREILKETSMLAIYILLGIFTMLFAIYFYLRGIAGIMNKKMMKLMPTGGVE